MRSNILRGLSLAFFVRAPIAFSVLYLSISQYKIFSDNDILNIGLVLSISSLYSIIFAQTIGNVYNKKIRDYLIKDGRKITIATLILIISVPFILSAPLFLTNSWVPYAIFVASSQALFQWVLSFFTVKGDHNKLLMSSFFTTILLCIITVLLNFEIISRLDVWYCLIGLSYILSFVSFIIQEKIIQVTGVSLKLFISEVKVLFQEILTSFSLFPILSLIYWFYEFYPRISGNHLSLDYNIYMTIIIGLVGAIEVGLGQYFQKAFLTHSSNGIKKFYSFFKEMIMSYSFIFILVIISAITLKPIYWNTFFKLNIDKTPLLFNLLVVSQCVRILNFLTFNSFYYLDLKNRTNLCIMLIFTIGNVSLLALNVIDLIFYVIIFILITVFIGGLNFFKLKNYAKKN